VELTIIIALYVCGLVAMIVELFIPGMIIGTMGFMATLASIIFAFATGHLWTAVVLVGTTLAFVPLFFALWKGVVGKYFALKSDVLKDARPSTTVGEELVGLEGVAVTALRPTGIAHLGERRYDVITQGEMLDKGTRIKVVEVSGNRIVVEQM